jgi:hypothetical protein
MHPSPRVQSKTFDELEASLRELQRLYAEQPVRRRELRDLVIRAKDRARFASRNSKAAPEKRAVKREMVQWMLVWLDDPAMFADWIAMRRPRL